MSPSAAPPLAANIVAQLRNSLYGLDTGRSRHGALPFGLAPIDARLPGGGLALGALHEIAGQSDDATYGAAAALFAAGIAARTKGQVLWCLTRADLFAPALAQAGLNPDRVIYFEAGNEKALLAAFEEGLRYGGLGAVVAELSQLNLTQSRRLQLAAETSGAIGLAVRRWNRSESARVFGLPNAATTRWRIGLLPSSPLPVRGVGRARWRLDLMRCRGGEAAQFDVEACDVQGRLALPAQLVHRPIDQNLMQRGSEQDRAAS